MAKTRVVSGSAAVIALLSCVYVVCVCRSHANLCVCVCVCVCQQSDTHMLSSCHPKKNNICAQHVVSFCYKRCEIHINWTEVVVFHGVSSRDDAFCVSICTFPSSVVFYCGAKGVGRDKTLSMNPKDKKNMSSHLLVKY